MGSNHTALVCLANQKHCTLLTQSNPYLKRNRFIYRALFEVGGGGGGGGGGKLIIVSPCQDPPWSSVSFEYLVPKLINEPTLIVDGVLAKSIKRRDSDWLSESMWYDSSLDVSKDSSRQRASRSLSRKRLLQYQYLVSKGRKGSGKL